MPVHILGDVTAWCHATFGSCLSIPQRKNLALGVVALMRAKTVNVSTIARGLPLAITFHGKRERIDRFVGNPRVSSARCLASAFPAILAKAERRRGYLLILLDHTDMGPWRVCTASVLFKKRAIPLLIRTLPASEPEVSQNREERTLLHDLRQLLPEKVRPLLIADRGFGRVTLFRELQRTFQWAYAIRVKGMVWIEKGRMRGKLRDLPRRKIRQNVRYHQTVKFVTTLVTAWLPGHPDPWFIATTLGDPVFVRELYATRMKIEELFRDEKFHLGMRRMRARQKVRVERLLLVLLLAVLLLSILGAAVHRFPSLARMLVERLTDAGLVFLGLQAILTLTRGDLRRIWRLVPRALSRA